MIVCYELAQEHVMNAEMKGYPFVFAFLVRS